MEPSSASHSCHLAKIYIIYLIIHLPSPSSAPVLLLATGYIRGLPSPWMAMLFIASHSLATEGADPSLL